MNIGILEYQKFHGAYTETLKALVPKATLFTDIDEAKKADLDVLFVNTIRAVPWDMIHWMRFKPKCKTILTIHEANTELFFFRPFLKKFDAISVLLPSIREYIIENNLYKGKILTIPFLLHEKVYPNTNNMYVVPGKIEKFRRDYDALFEIIYDDEKWCLLGEPMGRYGKRIIEYCKKLNKDGYNIKTFDTFVPQQEYDNILKGCKSIVAPLKIRTRGLNKLRTEIYGKTKACGSMFEAVKYGKPIVSEVQVDYHDFLPKDWKNYIENEVENL